MNKIRLGVDVGGTEIKFLVIENKKIIYQNIIETNRESVDGIVNDIVAEYKKISKDIKIDTMGVGIPGGIYGDVVTTDNLPFKNYPLQGALEKQIDIPVCIDNDANCAVLGEKHMGSGEKYENIVMVTLGTGVGGGVIIGGKICHGNGEFGEIGHMVIDVRNGRKCNCGREGCYEQYASATALVRRAAEVGKENPGSRLYEYLSNNDFKINGRTFFKIFDEGCEVCKKVFEEYIDFVVAGLKNVESIFDPDIIILAGGITRTGDTLMNAIRSRNIMRVPVEVSKLAGDAGAVGAAYLL